MCLGTIRDTLNKTENKKMVVFIGATISFIIMAIILILGHLLSNVVTPYLAIGLIALLSYHTTLCLDNYSKADSTLSEGVIRNALTATFIVMYVAYFSFSSNALNTAIFPLELTETLTKFTALVVGFYFASTVASELISKWKGPG